MPRNTFSRFIKQAFATGLALLIITSVAPSTLLETGLSADFFIDSEILPDEFVLDGTDYFTTDDGYVLKTNPSLEEGGDINRIGFTDNVKHTVASGETFSGIADRYGVKMETIEWANNTSRDQTLRIGQTLIIPPVDGFEHVVKGGGETLSKIAKTYKVDAELVKQHNGLTSDVIQKGQHLFIPGGKKPVPVVVRNTPSRSGSRSYNTFEIRSPSQGSNAQPLDGKSFIFPTVGKLSQGFKSGHYAVDISNSGKPDVWAAAEGTVIKVSGGCPSRSGPSSEWNLRCNSGYGNHVIIDHGDGWKTLYAHMDAIYVEKDQSVTQGQIVGRMGNSGRVYGATGIHLHFECISDGVKINPGRCY